MVAAARIAERSAMELRTFREPTYLRAVASGEFQIRPAQRQFMDLLDSMIQNGADRVLFDGRLVTGDLTTLERYLYGSFAAQLSSRLPARVFPQPPKFAYVLEHPVLDANRLGETVARNRGMSLRAFDNYDEAMAWLLSGER
jgi:hypothetical protein